MTGESGVDRWANKQFLLWMVIAVPAFTVCALALAAADVSPLWAFAAGILFNEAIDPVLHWFLDWLEVEREVAGFAE